MPDLQKAAAVVIGTIDGMAGIGKTALAVHAAHRMVDRFPDGQLFIDLHGYTRGLAPIEPAEALDRLLRDLGVPGTQIPTGLDQRAALYRTRLADQQMLILLDNAATEAQVAPLLSGTAGCLVLVTSRRGLAGLDHTHTRSLDTGRHQTLPRRGSVTRVVIEIPGRSFRRGEVQRTELLAVTRDFEASRHLFTKDMSNWAYDVRLVEGDLDVDGPLDLFEQELAVLVVTGRLVVRGHYGDRDDPESGTFVLGSMQADSVITAGWLNVAGSLLVRGGLIGDYNDCSATIGGQTRARFLHTEEHWFSFGGDVHVDVVLGPARGEWPASTTLQELPASRYPEVLVPEVFYLDGARGEPFDRTALSEEEVDDLDDLLLLDRRELLGRTRRGEPVFAQPS